MATIFRKKQYLVTNCRHYYDNYTKNNHLIYNHITKSGAQQQHYAKYYSRLSNLFRRSGKDVHVPAPFVLPSKVSGFCSSSSTNTAATVFTRIGFVGWYLGLIKSRPLLTKSLTSSLIYAAADVTSQTIALPSSESYDFIRTLRMAGYGLVGSGPTLHYWFNFMSKVLPGRDVLATAKKMILGQVVYGPVMIVVFFSLNAALQGENAKEIVARLRRDFFPTIRNCLIYWPVCDFITFRFPPVHLQPLVSNGFSFVWTVYMTYMASLEKATE
ncbi:protein SYM1-like [Silene latifolia]|uniref:protein SYM1-like n=1 Tax=Silene latifolia TaxID=37657 RepID=UPI003D77EDD6